MPSIYADMLTELDVNLSKLVREAIDTELDKKIKSLKNEMLTLKSRIDYLTKKHDVIDIFRLIAFCKTEKIDINNALYSNQAPELVMKNIMTCLQVKSDKLLVEKSELAEKINRLKLTRPTVLSA